MHKAVLLLGHPSDQQFLKKIPQSIYQVPGTVRSHEPQAALKSPDSPHFSEERLRLRVGGTQQEEWRVPASPKCPFTCPQAKAPGSELLWSYLESEAA